MYLFIQLLVCSLLLSMHSLVYATYTKVTNSGKALPDYAWTTSDNESANGKTASFTFSSVGTKAIPLTVTGSNCGTNSVQKSVTGKTLNLSVASFTATPCTGKAPLTVNLDAPGSPANVSITSYAWSSSDNQTTNGSSASITYNNAGAYTVALTVTDNKNKTTTKSTTIIIDSAVPVASLSYFLTMVG